MQIEMSHHTTRARWIYFQCETQDSLVRYGDFFIYLFFAEKVVRSILSPLCLRAFSAGSTHTPNMHVKADWQL